MNALDHVPLVVSESHSDGSLLDSIAAPPTTRSPLRGLLIDTDGAADDPVAIAPEPRTAPDAPEKQMRSIAFAVRAPDKVIVTESLVVRAVVIFENAIAPAAPAAAVAFTAPSTTVVQLLLWLSERVKVGVLAERLSAEQIATTKAPAGIVTAGLLCSVAPLVLLDPPNVLS